MRKGLYFAGSCLVAAFYGGSLQYVVLAQDQGKPARWRGIDQSEIDPGVVAGGEGGRTGVVGGAGVAGAARDGAGMLDAALGGRSDLMDGVSKGLSSSLCGGLNRVNGGPPGAGG